MAVEIKSGLLWMINLMIYAKRKWESLNKTGICKSGKGDNVQQDIIKLVKKLNFERSMTKIHLKMINHEHLHDDVIINIKRIGTSLIFFLLRHQIVTWIWTSTYGFRPFISFLFSWRYRFKVFIVYKTRVCDVWTI